MKQRAVLVDTSSSGQSSFTCTCTYQWLLVAGLGSPALRRSNDHYLQNNYSAGSFPTLQSIWMHGAAYKRETLAVLHEFITALVRADWWRDKWQDETPSIVIKNLITTIQTEPIY